METKIDASYREAMLADVLEGLRSTPKTLPSKYFYDEKGSLLFDDICELDEYYPTRTEVGIMQTNIADIVAALGDGVQLIELGSGSSTKTHLLLEQLADMDSYVPIDISEEHLLNAADRIRSLFPGLQVKPVAADYTRPFQLPVGGAVSPTERVVYFPGSTIGNFTPDDAVPFLKNIASIAGSGSSLLIGVDLVKEKRILELAYNDARGVTAAFNLNMLDHMNKVLDTDIKVSNFEHMAIFNETESRIEMHLESQVNQRFAVEDEFVDLAAGETIHTENSYKYTLEGFRELISEFYTFEQVWTDSQNLFSVQLYRAK